MTKIRVIIAEDHPIVVKGIRDLFAEHGERFDILDTFQDGKSLLQSANLPLADVLLLDLNLPKLDGLHVLEQLQTQQIRAKTIVFTSYLSHQLATQCRELGAAGYLVKSQGLSELTNWIDEVLAGNPVFPDALAPENMEDADGYFLHNDEFLKKYKLTKREVQIIKLVCQEQNSDEIAHVLHLSPFTVKTHRRNIIRKLGLEDSTISLYKFAQANGLL